MALEIRVHIQLSDAAHEGGARPAAVLRAQAPLDGDVLLEPPALAGDLFDEDDDDEHLANVVGPGADPEHRDSLRSLPAATSEATHRESR